MGESMSLTCVKMSEEVWLTCVIHALATETEEIMGLHIGDIQFMNSGSATALILGASPQMRSDRPQLRKDRVETNPELLAAASAQAENDTDNRKDYKGDWVVSFTSTHYCSSISCSGAQYVRKEVSLQVLPAKSLLKLNSPLTSFTDMQHVLFEEERSAYNKAVSPNMRNGEVHPLAFIHHTSTYQAYICKLMEYCISPAINTLQDRLKENETRLTMLMEEVKSLEVEALRRETERSSESTQSLHSHGVRGNFFLYVVSPPSGISLHWLKSVAFTVAQNIENSLYDAHCGYGCTKYR